MKETGFFSLLSFAVLLLMATLASAVEFSLNEEDLINAAAAEPGTAHPFGLVQQRSINLLADEFLQPASHLHPDQLIFHAHVYSKDARGLAVHFDGLANVLDGQLSLINPRNGRKVSVRIPESFDNEESGLLSPYLAGDELVVEWMGSESDAESAHIHIDHLVHDAVGVQSLQKSTDQATVVFPTYNLANECTNDAVCPQGQGYEDQRRSVVQYFFRYNENVYATCSGVMLNSSSQNGAQYLLSAEQCVQFSRRRWLREASILFNYQRKYCNDTAERQPYYGDQVVGLEIITASQETDMVLFNVVEEIPNKFGVFLAGWDARRRIWEDVVAFNYPLADVKKVVKSNRCLGPMVAYGPAVYGSRVVNYNLPYFYEMIPTCGRSWAGSTGGPLFNGLGLVIGQLSQIVPRSTSANCNTCKTREFYGAFAASYYNLGSHSLINFLNSDRFPDAYLNGIYLSAARNNGLLKSTRFGGAMAVDGKSDDDEYEYICDGDSCRRVKKDKKKKKKKKGKKKSSAADSLSDSSSSD